MFSFKPAWVGRCGPNNFPPALKLTCQVDIEAKQAKAVLKLSYYEGTDLAEDVHPSTSAVTGYGYPAI